MHNLLTAPAFGTKHLLGLAVIAIVNIILITVLKRKDFNKKKLVLVFLIIFYVLEFMKLGYMIFRDGSYPMNHLPLHLCSLPLYVYPILYLAKPNSKLEEIMNAAAFGPIISAGVIALLIPANIIGGDSWLPLSENYLPLVSFTYHGFMIFTSLYFVVSGIYKISFKGIYQAIQVTLGLMILALIANYLLDKDFMLLNRGSGSPFQFLLDYGQFVYTTAMILLGFVGVSLPFLIGMAVIKVKSIFGK